MRWFRVVILACFVGASACSSHHLSPASCNASVASWNAFVRQVADYNDSISYFREPVEAAVAVPKDSNRVMIAHVDPGVVKAVLVAPSVSAFDFKLFPDVELKVQDVQTDFDLFARAVSKTEFTLSTGEWGTWTSPHGFVYDLVALEVKPGIDGADAFDILFGRILRRKDADYSDALASMRSAYESQCGGNASEIRSLEAFK
jgi:hypothetical protein